MGPGGLLGRRAEGIDFKVADDYVVRVYSLFYLM